MAEVAFPAVVDAISDYLLPDMISLWIDTFSQLHDFPCVFMSADPRVGEITFPFIIPDVIHADPCCMDSYKHLIFARHRCGILREYHMARFSHKQYLHKSSLYLPCRNMFCYKDLSFP